jgi:hypothetical protein
MLEWKRRTSGPMAAINKMKVASWYLFLCLDFNSTLFTWGELKSGPCAASGERVLLGVRD